MDGWNAAQSDRHVLESSVELTDEPSSKWMCGYPYRISACLGGPSFGCFGSYVKWLVPFLQQNVYLRVRLFSCVCHKLSWHCYFHSAPFQSKLTSKWCRISAFNWVKCDTLDGWSRPLNLRLIVFLHCKRYRREYHPGLYMTRLLKINLYIARQNFRDDLAAGVGHSNRKASIEHHRISHEPLCVLSIYIHGCVGGILHATHIWAPCRNACYSRKISS